MRALPLPGSYPDGSAPQHWRQDRVFSGDNIMSMGIWYEAMMRWVGPAKSVMAVGQSVVRHRRDASGRRVPMEIPDHIDVIGAMAQGGQMRFNVSAVLGHAPDVADVHIFGTDGTIRLRQPVGGAMALFAGKRGKAELDQVEIDPAKRGGWRVEEEFVNAIRGKERDNAHRLRYWRQIHGMDDGGQPIAAQGAGRHVAALAAQEQHQFVVIPSRPRAQAWEGRRSQEEAERHPARWRHLEASTQRDPGADEPKAPIGAR